MTDKEKLEAIKDVFSQDESKNMWISREILEFLIKLADNSEMWKERYIGENEKVLKLIEHA